MCLLLAIYRQKRQHPHTLNTLSVRGLRVVDDEPRRDKAIIANLDKSRATLMKESDPLCFFTVSTKPLLDLLRGIVVMLERKRREMALFDPLPWPLLARWSPRDIHPLLLPKAASSGWDSRLWPASAAFPEALTTVCAEGLNRLGVIPETDGDH